MTSVGQHAWRGPGQQPEAPASWVPCYYGFNALPRKYQEEVECTQPPSPPLLPCTASTAENLYHSDSRTTLNKDKSGGAAAACLHEQLSPHSKAAPAAPCSFHYATSFHAELAPLSSCCSLSSLAQTHGGRIITCWSWAWGWCTFCLFFPFAALGEGSPGGSHSQRSFAPGDTIVHHAPSATSLFINTLAEHGLRTLANSSHCADKAKLFRFIFLSHLKVTFVVARHPECEGFATIGLHNFIFALKERSLKCQDRASGTPAPR